MSIFCSEQNYLKIANRSIFIRFFIIVTLGVLRFLLFYLILHLSSVHRVSHNIGTV